MSTETYSSNLIIVEHFDEIKRQIDIHTETLLSKTEIDCDEKEKINKLICAIEKIQDVNLNLSSQREFDSKWKHVFAANDKDNGQKEELFKEDLIKIDCLIIHGEEFNLKLNLLMVKGYLRIQDRDFFSNFDSAGQILKEKVIQFNRHLIKISLFDTFMTRNICILNQLFQTIYEDGL